jgi:hypothetical protein
MKIKEIISDTSKIRHYTGLSIEKFQSLVKEIRLLKSRMKPLCIYKNKPGAGRHSNLTLEEQIAIVLIYYRSYCSQETLAHMSGVHQSNISRIIDRIEPFIEQAADQGISQTLVKIKENKDSIDSLSKETFDKKYPELERVVTDATELYIQRPGKDNETRKLYYLGKAKAFTVKFQVSVSKKQKFLHITKPYPGSIHDKNIMDCERTIEQFPKHSHQILDAGYQGVVEEYPDHYVNTPIKKQKNCELSDLAKEQNKNLAKRRICVENSLARPNKFLICAQIYRGRLCKIERVFRNVTALCNLMLVV